MPCARRKLGDPPPVHRLITAGAQAVHKLAARHTAPAEGVPSLAKPVRWSIPTGWLQSWQQCGRLEMARLQQVRTISLNVLAPAQADAAKLLMPRQRPARVSPRPNGGQVARYRRPEDRPSALSPRSQCSHNAAARTYRA